MPAAGEFFWGCLRRAAPGEIRGVYSKKSEKNLGCSRIWRQFFRKTTRFYFVRIWRGVWRLWFFS